MPDVPDPTAEEAESRRYNALFETPAFDHIYTFTSALYATPLGTPEQEARRLGQFVAVGREAWQLTTTPDERERLRRHLATIACGLLMSRDENYKCDDTACFGLVDTRIIAPPRSVQA